MRVTLAELGRAAGACALSLGLVVFGLVATGSTARARELVARATAPRATVEPLQGSRAGAARAARFDGSPAVVTPASDPRSPATVLSLLEQVAHRESRDRGLELPYVVAEGAPSGGGIVVWTDARTGARKGAIVRAAPSGTDYLLIEGSPRVEAPLGPLPAGASLAGGVPAPEGALPVLRVEDRGRAVSLAVVPGAASSVATQVASSLAASGFEVDRDAARELGAPEASRVVVPFRGAGKRGLAVVSALDERRSRVSWLVEEDR